MLKRHSFLGAVALFAALGAAHAQDDEPVEKRFYFVAGGNHTESDKQRGADGTAGFNVGFGKRITKRFGIELKGIFKNFDPDRSDRADGQPPATELLQYDTKALSIDLFYHLAGYSKWDPYIVAGLGRSDAEVRGTNADGDVQSDVDYNTGEIGVGVRNEFTEKGTAVRLDARYRVEKVASATGTLSDQEDDLNDFDDIVINFDFVIPFGARKVDAVDRPNPESQHDGRFYLVPTVQYSRPDGNRFGDDDIGFGLAFGKQYNDNSSIEFRVSQNDLDPQGTSNGTPLYDSWEILSFGVDLLLHREIYPKLQPYLLLGVGYQKNKIDNALPAATGTTLAAGDRKFDGYTIDYGFGVQSRGYRSLVGWRADVRNRHVTLDRDQDEGLDSRTSFEDVIVNVGAVIPLGANPYKRRDREEAAKRAAEAAAEAAAAAAAAEARRKADAEAAALAAAAVPEPKDSDGDNVLDEDDKCPNTPEGVTVDETGCELDGDNDGVKDSKDKCPNTPEGVTVDADGCELDSDNDGVKDSVDSCPNSPAGAEVDEKGCERDNDNDGVVNSLDQCPNSPEGLAVDAVGCTKAAQVIILEGVNFKTNSAELELNAKTILNKTAESLNLAPGLRVEIGGHTDWVGPAAYNKRLSNKRAESVKSYLISRGVSSSNLETQGYGESTPVADNKTADGRARNRRVELKTLGGDNGAEPAASDDTSDGDSSAEGKEGVDELVDVLTDE